MKLNYELQKKVLLLAALTFTYVSGDVLAVGGDGNVRNLAVDREYAKINDRIAANPTVPAVNRYTASVYHQDLMNIINSSADAATRLAAAGYPTTYSLEDIKNMSYSDYITILSTANDNYNVTFNALLQNATTGEFSDGIRSVNRRVDHLEKRVDRIEKRIDDVGAQSAALAGLHPLDFDPDNKFTLAAAMGGFRSSEAVAVGAFYRPNENMMVSAASTIGGRDNSYNVGVSLKFGSSDSTYRPTSMKKFMEEVRSKLAEQDAQIQALQDENKTLRLTQTRKSFPDVPADHWANEAVEILHGNDIVKGYPDGNFHGEQEMTRYEYAQLMYNQSVK